MLQAAVQEVNTTRKLTVFQNAEARLEQSRFRLDLILTKVDRAVAAGRISPSPQLDRAVTGARKQLAAAELSLERLENEDSPCWDRRRREVQAALEDLAESIQKVVARIQ